MSTLRQRTRSSQSVSHSIMGTLKAWPILSFIPPNIANQVKKAFVFGGAGNEALIILNNDDVYGLGFNGNGSLGVGDAESTLEPKRIDVLCKKEIADIAYGMGPHILIVTGEGDLYSWGHGGYGQLGHSEGDKCTPVMVIMPTPTKVCKVACGSYHSLAITVDGELYSWGSNNCGQLGNGPNNQPTPRRITGHLVSANKKVVSMSCGQSFSIALTEDGELYSWGYNGNGQLGLGSSSNQQSPQRVNGLQGKFIKKIACGMAHVLALTDTGTLYSWGANSYGQLGIGSTLNIAVPTEVQAEERWADIAGHHYTHISAAVTVTGKFCMWGQCHGLTLLQSREVAVSSLNDVFAQFGMPQIMYTFVDIDGCESHTVKDTIRRSFNDEESSDMTFVIDGKKIHVHKAILKIRCKYFQSMFSSHWKGADKDEVEVTEFPYEVYHPFLQYLYTDQVDLDPDAAIGLLALSDSYCLLRLKELCENIIMKGVSIDTVAMLIAAAEKYNAKELEMFCFRFAMNHLTAVTQTESFMALDGDTVKRFVLKASQNGAFKH